MLIQEYKWWIPVHSFHKQLQFSVFEIFLLKYKDWLENSARVNIKALTSNVANQSWHMFSQAFQGSLLNTEPGIA